MVLKKWFLNLLNILNLNKMKRILIIGAGTEQIAVIREAKLMGHFVIVTDFNPNAPGIAFADKFVLVSTTDGPGNAEVGKKENIDGVLTVCSETAVPTVAYVANELNLPSFSKRTALLGTNKSEMRKVLLENDVRVASFIVASEFSDCDSYFASNNGPWVIKPVDSSGQRGTNMVVNSSKLKHFFNEAKENSYSGNVLVDQFISGPEIHVTMHVIKGDVHFLAISDRITLDKENFGIAVRHLGHSDLAPLLKEDVKKLCKRGIKAIELENGVATCELIIQNGKPFVMELAVRVPGGYLREVASILSGVDINKTTIWCSLGDFKPFQELVTELKHPFVSVKFLTASNLDPSIKEIPSPPNCESMLNENVKLINFHFTKNFQIPLLNSSVARFGAIITVAKNASKALEYSEEVFSKIKINGLGLKEYTNYNPNNKDFKPLG